MVQHGGLITARDKTAYNLECNFLFHCLLYSDYEDSVQKSKRNIEFPSFQKFYLLEAGQNWICIRQIKTVTDFEMRKMCCLCLTDIIVFQIQRLYFTGNVCHPHMHHRNHHHTYDHCIMVSSTSMYYHTSARTSEKEKAKGK